jgi:hypothetical protein
MPTVTDRDLVEMVIEHYGWYPGDPQVFRITEYTARGGATCWGFDYTPENAYEASEYVLSPRIIFERSVT